MPGSPNTEETENGYEKAAEDGVAQAQHHLGYICYQRNDFSSAYSWYQKAALQGYLPACWRLAWLYKLGKGVVVNYDKAYELFDDAAKRGHLFAKRDLALMLIQGHRGHAHVFRGIGLLFRCILDAIHAAWNSDSDDRFKV